MFRYSPLLFLLLLTACNATRVVRPLEKGEQQVSASFGGPAIIFSGAPMPIPLTSVSYANGLDTGLTFSAGLHTTSLLFGVAHMDFGLSIEMWRSQNENFGLTAAPAIQAFYDLEDGNPRTYPQLDLLCWWEYGEGENFFYGGAGTWIELFREKAHGQVQENEWLPYVTLGHQFNRDRWSFQVEGRYLGLGRPNDEIVVNYLTPFDQGTTGLYFGITRKFGK